MTQHDITCANTAPVYHVEKDTLLPIDFRPSKISVICGRGRDNYQHVGNQRFRTLLVQQRDEYMSTTSRPQKSLMVVGLVRAIRRAFQQEGDRADSLGAFVRRDRKTGRWYDVGDASAREKVSHTLRDPRRTKDKNDKSYMRRNNNNKAVDNASTLEYIEQHQQALLEIMMQAQPEKPRMMNKRKLFSDQNSGVQLSGTTTLKQPSDCFNCLQMSIDEDLALKDIKGYFTQSDKMDCWNIHEDDLEEVISLEDIVLLGRGM